MQNRPIPALPWAPKAAAARNLEPKSGRSFQKWGFYAAIGLVFVRCSLLQEMLTYELHFDTYLVYALGIVAVVAILASGDLKRLFQVRAAYYWVAYAAWMILAVPFSIWKTNSFMLIMNYWRTNMVMLFALGMFITTWKQFKILLRTLALSCVAMLLVIHFFSQMDSGGRMDLKFSLVANSNDYPAHLLVLMPALLWVGFATKSFVIRLCSFGIFGYACYVVFASASRGALIAVAVGILYYLISATNKQRVAALAVGAVIALLMLKVLPPETLQRLTNFSTTDASSFSGAGSPNGAVESADTRKKLLTDSIWLTLKNPVFGVGPGQFSVAEGTSQKRLWLQTHNSYTEASSECGLPALIFLVGGIVCSFGIFRGAGREWRSDPQAREITQAAFCMKLMIVGFGTAIMFLNFAYLFHLPMIGGTSIAMTHSLHDWRRSAKQNPSRTPQRVGEVKSWARHRSSTRWVSPFRRLGLQG
ncbi:MAG TPA: O-antigen ligase family protein [Candidatus Acidoferrales bacterium]|nr:O-antigen ligase family protein [Candidatus Acidoferrales bacterium]